MSEQYTHLLEMPEWQKKRQQILERDGYSCKNCKSTVSLHVHHKQYHKSRFSGEFVSPWNYLNHYLITLCNECHRNGHMAYTVPVFNI